MLCGPLQARFLHRAALAVTMIRPHGHPETNSHYYVVYVVSVGTYLRSARIYTT